MIKMILTKTAVLRLFGSSLHYPTKVEVLKFEELCPCYQCPGSTWGCTRPPRPKAC